MFNVRFGGIEYAAVQVEADGPLAEDTRLLLADKRGCIVGWAAATDVVVIDGEHSFEDEANEFVDALKGSSVEGRAAELGPAELIFRHWKSANAIRAAIEKGVPGAEVCGCSFDPDGAVVVDVMLSQDAMDSKASDAPAKKVEQSKAERLQDPRQ